MKLTEDGRPYSWKVGPVPWAFNRNSRVLGDPAPF